MGKEQKRVEKLHKEIIRFMNRVADETGAKPVLALQYADKQHVLFGLDEHSDEIIANLYEKLFPTLEEEIDAIGKMNASELANAYSKSDIEELLGELDEEPDGKEKSALQDVLFDAINKIASTRKQRK